MEQEVTLIDVAKALSVPQTTDGSLAGDLWTWSGRSPGSRGGAGGRRQPPPGAGLRRGLAKTDALDAALAHFSDLPSALCATLKPSSSTPCPKAPTTRTA